MVREICKDEAFLAQKAEPATKDDLGTAQDLLDTLLAHKDGCVGMAANMIGVNKRIIAFDNDGRLSGHAQSRHHPSSPSPMRRRRAACPSPAPGRRSASRSIKVQWQNEKLQTRLKTFTGWTAEIIQHEIDHCEGILI